MDGFGISDLSRNYALRAQNIDLNRSMVRLSEEIVSGRSSDTTLRLNAQFSFLTQIETDLVKTQARADALSEVAITAAAQQSSLERVLEASGSMFETLALFQNDASALTVDTIAERARGLLDTMVASLNANQGGRYAFSGTDVDTPPLENTEALLQDLATARSGAATEAGVRALADDFFNLPTGGFATGIYQGAAQSLNAVNLGNGETATLGTRADDAALRDMIQSVAMVAVVDNPAFGIPDGVQRTLIQGQTDEVLNARSDVLELRAVLGFSEERIDRAATRLETELAGLELAKSDLLDVDPYETATALEAVRQQLETLYSITARTQNLSLVNFL